MSTLLPQYRGYDSLMNVRDHTVTKGLSARTPAGLPSEIDHYIDGRMVASTTGERFVNIEPVSNREYSSVAAGTSEDVDCAVRAAGRAFEGGSWSTLPIKERANVLRRIAQAIRDREDEIVTCETFDTGIPVTQVKGQAARAAENFDFFASLIVALHEDAFSVDTRQLNYVLRKPIGVAGLITPWNTPFMLETWKLAPALASGCSVVLKPAEWTPLSASLLPAIMEEAGVSPGVFNVVHGIGEIAGASLVAHHAVPLISFTGETITGRNIMRSSADHLKGLSMELGGKSPCIVFSDADIEAAVDSALFGAFSLNGERCTASSRVLVETSVYDAFVSELAQRAKRVVVGLPEDPATELGALVHPDHYGRVVGYVTTGIEEGAELVAGGSRPSHLSSGNFLEATVFANVAPTMRIFQEEIFGPVMCVTPFSTEDQAVTLANGTKFGLAAYIWTNDIRRAHRLASRMDAGMTWINSHNVRDLRTPFGGLKASGVGQEGGERSIDFYTSRRAVHVALEALHVARFGL